MRILILAAVLAAASPSAVSAQTTPPAAPSPNVLAMAAGYKALTVCSAVKNAEAAGGSRTVESVETHELRGIYPELDGLVRDLPVRVDGDRVSVPWDEAMPARTAVYRPGRGCAIMPVGWEGEVPDIMPPGRRLNAPLAERRLRGDAAALDAVVERAFDGGYGQGTDTTAVVILQDGALVSETYAPGFGVDTPQRTWSVAKSLAGTVVGAAVLRGDANVEAPAAIIDWERDGDPRAAVTLDQLLRMASGLTSDTMGNRTDALYFGGVGVDEQATTWPLIARPGTRFRYANNDILLATLSIAPTFEAHPPAELFRRLRMYDTIAETDWRGNYMLSSQVWSTARDLARFGQLYLDNGVVDGERVLPDGWRDYVSRPSGPQPMGEQGYGATFWLMNRSEGIPQDTISANGNRGQYVVVVPARGLVIVRRAEDPAGRRFDVVAFTRDVLAAAE